MSSGGSSRTPDQSRRPASAFRRRVRKAGRIIFYGLLMACPVFAGSRPAWACGLFGLAWTAWFLFFLLPQYSRNGAGGRPWPALGLVIVAGWCFVQALWPHASADASQWPDERFLSANPWTSLQQGVTFLTGAVVFAGAAWMVDSSERIRALLLCLAVSGGLLCIIAFAVATDNGHFLESYKAWLPEYQVAATRLRGTYSNNDRFAALLLLYIPCMVGLWVSLHFTSWRRDGPPSFHAITKDFRLTLTYTLYWSGITLLIATLFLTGCRAAAIIGTFCALLVLFVYGRKLLARRRGYAPFLVVVVLLILQQVLFGFERVTSRLGTLDVDWQTRATGWNYAINLVRGRPFQGWGAGCYADVAPTLPTYSESLVWNHAHNQYLEYASGLGLLATLLLLGCLVWWGHEVMSAMRHLRSRRRVYVICIFWATVSVLMVGLVDVPLYEPATLWVLLTLMGAAWGIATRPNEPLSPDEPPPSLLSWQEAHVAESAPHQRSHTPAPRLLVLGLGIGALAGVGLAALLFSGGLKIAQARMYHDKPLDIQDPRWRKLLEDSAAKRWNARPAALMAQIGLERHLEHPISPADQLFDPPLFDPARPVDRLDSPYRIRRNLLDALQVEPLNAELYFYLALLDYLQRMPPASQARDVLATLQPDMLRLLLAELHPTAVAEERLGWDKLTADELRTLVGAASQDALTEAMVRALVVLPLDIPDWRLQTIRHLGVATAYSKGYARMQLFCGLVRLHLWNSQGTGTAELERGMQEMKNAFEHNPALLRPTMPLLGFLGLKADHIDQVIPDDPEQHFIAMEVYASWGLEADALRHLAKAEELSAKLADLPEDEVTRLSAHLPQIALYRGMLYMRTDNIDNGIQAFQKYLDQPPAEGLMKRATEIDQRWGMAGADQQVLFWKAQQDKYPEQTKWVVFLAHAADRTGDTRAAQEYYTQCLKDYDSAGVRLRLAALTAAPTAQIEHLRKALEFAPDNISARAWLVLKLQEQGDMAYIHEREILVSQLGDRTQEDDSTDPLPPEVQRAIQRQ
ncbi:MAG TPA: O-antigen ligase family protein [Planctomycetota bacterium]|nr:O-antigen ligase family protein [Planctomycetota bacterium]